MNICSPYRPQNYLENYQKTATFNIQFQPASFSALLCCIFDKFGGEQEETLSEQIEHLPCYLCIIFQEYIQETKDRKQVDKDVDVCIPCVNQTRSLLHIPYYPLYMSQLLTEAVRGSHDAARLGS